MGCARREIAGIAVIGAVIALAGCARASAQGAPAQSAPVASRLAGIVRVPADWRELPELADAGKLAAPGADVAAWGEAGLGCFAVVVATRAAAQNPEDALEELRTSLVESLGLAAWTAAIPVDVRGQLTRGPMRGELRAAVVLAPPGGAAATVATCFSNQREPDGCRVSCQGVLASLDASKVKP